MTAEDRPWSIGIFSGDSPFTLRPHPANPVLTAADADDIDAQFLADPFMVHTDAGWTMFFEVLERPSQIGVIAAAHSDDGFTWRYDRVVLRETFHLSYPCVFAWEGHWYMVPETLGAGGVRLYRADPFPLRWLPAGHLIAGEHADPTLFQHGGRWWLFTCPRPYRHDSLCLFHAPQPSGPWQPHAGNPIQDDAPGSARPAGRVIHWQERLFRLSQDCRGGYGRAINGFEIRFLSTNGYVDQFLPDNPIMAGSGSGWNATHMHHLDAHRLEDGTWLACADGQGRLAKPGIPRPGGTAPGGSQ